MIRAPPPGTSRLGGSRFVAAAEGGKCPQKHGCICLKTSIS